MSRNGEDEMTDAVKIEALKIGTDLLAGIGITQEQRITVGERVRELLAKPVATREAVRDRLVEQQNNQGVRGMMEPPAAWVDMIMDALTHFAPPSPPPPEGLPSVEEIEKLMGADETIRSGSWPTPHCARVARALLEKHARGRMMIDGMTPDQLHLVFIKEWVSLHPSTSAPPIKFAFHCATAAYRLATTPPPVAPKVDEDAGAKGLGAQYWRATHPRTDVKADDTEIWLSVYSESQRDFWRAVAAKQVKP